MGNDAERSIRALISVVEEARTIARAGVVGAVLGERLGHAQELLDVIYCELLQFDPAKQRTVFETAASLRGKHERLRDELRGQVKL